LQAGLHTGAQTGLQTGLHGLQADWQHPVKRAAAETIAMANFMFPNLQFLLSFNLSSQSNQLGSAVQPANTQQNRKTLK
jgi:hypothetical protein